MSTFTIFLVLITIVCFLLIVVIMVQNPKGGGLSSTFGSSSQMGGVQKTTDFLDKSNLVFSRNFNHINFIIKFKFYMDQIVIQVQK